MQYQYQYPLSSVLFFTVFFHCVGDAFSCSFIFIFSIVWVKFGDISSQVIPGFASRRCSFLCLKMPHDITTLNREISLLKSDQIFFFGSSAFSEVVVGVVDIVLEVGP